MRQGDRCLERRDRGGEGLAGRKGASGREHRSGNIGTGASVRKYRNGKQAKTLGGVFACFPFARSGWADSRNPDWDDLPDKAGCLNNLYIRGGYRHPGLGSKLFGMAMDWLDGFRGAEVVFIFVSNGNEAALKFYLSRGFAFSHDVFGGFIQATYRRRT
ncbi:GNAT family N-acetyltransferase [Paenibacillus sp. UNC496MF]|uniref:GNAT family N-acetyltransferase n=1 Tax=Paenibacillus sp. UNC496MF TaxID=1502753 RepID=UPI00210B0CDE|nr:GNAT family N-acetyltransferase [Paenibacillus sp. UNC496MF]